MTNELKEDTLRLVVDEARKALEDIADPMKDRDKFALKDLARAALRRMRTEVPTEAPHA